MVEFSNSEDINRWLQAIKSAKRRREVAVALVARAALRATPLLGREARPGRRSQAFVLANLVLPSLRAAAAAWAVAQYPAHGSELSAAAVVAGRAASAAVAPRAVARLVAEEAVVYSTVEDASLAGILSVRAASLAAAVYRTAEGASRLGELSVRTAEEGALAAAASTVFAAVYPYPAYSAAALADADLIDAGRSGSELMGIPLWPNRSPDQIEVWGNLKAALLAADEGWKVWTDWYEARLAGDVGHPPNEALEIARATIPDEIWRQGPAVVNAEIKRLIAEHQSLQQRPAAFQFRVVDDKIDALPEDARPIDARDAHDLYDEAKRKARDLKDRLQRAQADVDLRAHVDLLLTRLGESYAAMRLGFMLSALRSLQSDVRAYDSEEGRKELSAALLSSILDLAEGVRDLCAMFPRSREIEAEAVSLDLPLERMSEIRSTIDDVVAKVSHSDGVTEDGREAINASAADLAHQRSLADEAKQSAYFLVDFANFLRAGLKHLKTAGAVFGRELGGLSADSWRAVRRGAPKGIELGAAQATRALFVGGVGTLMHGLGGDIAALGSMVAAYAPLHEILEGMSGPPPETPGPNAPLVDAEAEASRAPAPRKPTTRRSPAKTPARKRTRPGNL
jgi:hypothetical protein